MNYSSANIQGWQPFSFTLATLLNCHEGFIVVSSHWAFLIKYKDVWLVGMLEAMLLDDRLCVLVGYTGVM